MFPCSFSDLNFVITLAYKYKVFFFNKYTLFNSSTRRYFVLEERIGVIYPAPTKSSTSKLHDFLTNNINVFVTDSHSNNTSKSK